MIRILSKIILVAGLGILAAASSFASDLFTYQGKLTNAAASPLPDGQYRIGVRIWNVASGGDKPLWSRKYDVPVGAGVFSLMIGAEGLPWGTVGAADGPLTASLKLAVSGTNRFLEITVMSDSNGPEKPAGQWQVLAPRQALGAVPYAMNGVPPGTVVPFAGVVIPNGWARCDGESYPVSDARYAALALALDEKYGNNGPGTFRVPDLRGRTAIGTGAGDTRDGDDSAPPTDWTLAQKFGAERHRMTIDEMPKHNHNVRDLGHAHPIQMYADWAPGTRAVGAQTPAHDTQGQGGTLNATANIAQDDRGSDQPHNNMQPSLALNYIIKF